MKLFCAFIGKIWQVLDLWLYIFQGFASAQSGDTASLDCFTDNGGCSHFCRSDACSCPPCWTLDTDGFTCVPDPSHVTTTCGPSGMSIDVDECVYNGDTMTLTLNDGVCEGQGSLIQSSADSPPGCSWDMLCWSTPFSEAIALESFNDRRRWWFCSLRCWPWFGRMRNNHYWCWWQHCIYQ